MGKGIINFFVSLCLISLTCIATVRVHAEDVNGNLGQEPNTGRGSVEQVYRGRTAKRQGRSMSETYEGCMKTKICFGDTDTCPQNKDCKFMAGIHKSSNGYEFDLMSTGAAANTYVAVGISEIGTAMEDVAIISCKSAASSDVDTSFSTDKTSTAIHKVTDEITLENTKPNTFEEGTIKCHFTLKPSFTITHENKQNSFDLDKKKYKILIAVGKYDTNKPSTNGLTYHNSERRITPHNIDLKNPSKGTSAPTPSSALYLVPMPSFSIFALFFTFIFAMSLN